jgi:hypothetical protein
MRTNPGGLLDPEDVVGRDSLIKHLWGVLERQSVLLTAERRMGKTSVIRKMEAERAPGTLPVFQELEDVHTPLEFAEKVWRGIDGHLSTIARTTTRARRLLSSIPGAEVGGVIKFPSDASSQWKPLLKEMMADVVEHQQARVIFFWDEIPFMLDNIRKRVGEPVAMEVLDTLRALRQTHRSLRMVFTGSIGLHHVLSGLRRAGHGNAPINDMAVVTVPPFSPEDAQELALALIEGEQLLCREPHVLAREIALAVDCIPFYIHQVVYQMKERGRSDIPCVGEVVLSSLVEPQDPWQLRYFRERIQVHWTQEMQPLALAILDGLAAADGPLTWDEVFHNQAAYVAASDRERTRDALTLLQRDHYIVQDADGRYRFTLPLIRRSWRMQLGIA